MSIKAWRRFLYVLKRALLLIVAFCDEELGEERLDKSP
jgi:hypothetical protein